jgi:hypothetical protein
MQQPGKNDLYIKISNFGYAHPEGFGYEAIIKELKLNKGGWEDVMIRGYMDNAIRSGETENFPHPNGNSTYSINPSLDSMFFLIERGQSRDLNSHKFILKYDAYFNYIDYLELQAVKEQSEKSEKHAICAIWIASA